MSDPRHDDFDRRFVERLAGHYRPEPFGAMQRARFDATLRERIESRRRMPRWLPALAGSAAALAIAWWSWPLAAPSPAPEGEVRIGRAEIAPAEAGDAAEPTGWEADVMLVDADDTLAEEEYLPDEYLVIATAFIDGV